MIFCHEFELDKTGVTLPVGLTFSLNQTMPSSWKPTLLFSFVSNKVDTDIPFPVLP